MSAFEFNGVGWASFGTMHGKERVVAPMLLDHLELEVRVADNIDTDAPGTFTPERARLGSARAGAPAKARLALDSSPGAAYGIGSEGSFVPTFLKGIRDEAGLAAAIEVSLTMHCSTARLHLMQSLIVKEISE